MYLGSVAVSCFISFIHLANNEYFVDPASNTSNLELGTKQHPYKNFDDPFREIYDVSSLLTTTSG